MICNGMNGPNSAGSCRILKAPGFSGTALVLNGITQGSIIEGISIDGAPGNQGDGVQIIANSIVLRDVTVVNQGGNGIYIGEEPVRDGSQANSFLLERVRSARNKGNGYVIRKEDIAGPHWSDANAGTMTNCVAQFNGADGLLVGAAIDNTFIGMLLEQNLGYGVHLSAGSGEQVFIGGDFNEGNHKGNVQIDADSSLSSYFVGTDTGSSIVDNGRQKSYFLNRSFGLTVGTRFPTLAQPSRLVIRRSLAIVGFQWAIVVPAASICEPMGGPGSTLYVCERGHWAAK